MKKLLTMVVVGSLALLGCAGEEQTSESRFVGGGEQENPKAQTVAPPAGKYYLGVGKRKAYPAWQKLLRSGHEYIENTEVDIHLEVDFSTGRPVVNVKTSGDPHECDQIPSDALTFDKLTFEKYGQRDWTGKWTNAKGQKFDILLRQDDNDSDTPGRIQIFFNVVYKMQTSSGMQEACYDVRDRIYHETETETEVDKRPYLLPLKEVKAKFGSGDNCDASDSNSDS